MGVATESGILTQLKKGQGETNQRLDAVLAELVAMRQLLERLAAPERSQQ